MRLVELVIGSGRIVGPLLIVAVERTSVHLFRATVSISTVLMLAVAHRLDAWAPPPGG